MFLPTSVCSALTRAASTLSSRLPSWRGGPFIFALMLSSGSTLPAKVNTVNLRLQRCLQVHTHWKVQRQARWYLLGIAAPNAARGLPNRVELGLNMSRVNERGLVDGIVSVLVPGRSPEYRRRDGAGSSARTGLCSNHGKTQVWHPSYLTVLRNEEHGDKERKSQSRSYSTSRHAL
ncbi:hypothetical protein Bbelb_006350 [Branchiostoma belcheri]|nr:hypothetical protein Bbelb_006350 [Branchiostoma belcheri]